MKRFLSCLAAMLAVPVLLSAFTAFAEGGHTRSELILLPKPSLYRPRAPLYDLSIVGELKTGCDVTFTVNDEGVEVLTLAIERDWSEYMQVVYDTAGSSFTYHFSEPGYYILWADEEFVDDFTVTGEDLLGARIREILSDCTATDDYDKAVWLHDWLTLNTYYDSTMTYHGADYLLTEGYGVCQSYTNAYIRMLRAAGIDCEDVSGAGHSWNAVEIDDEWYEVDITWDTVGEAAYGEGSPSSFNSHLYCLIPDRIMALDHEGYGSGYQKRCTSMAANYYVRSGIASDWAEGLFTADGFVLTGSSSQATLEPEAGIELFADKQGYFTVSKQLTAAAIAQVLDGSLRTNAAGIPYQLTASATGSSLSLSAVPIVDYSEMDVLTLPTGLEVLGAEALAKTNAEVIIIPESITSVAADSFNDCGRLKIIVNRSSVEITAPNGVLVLTE